MVIRRLDFVLIPWILGFIIWTILIALLLCSEFFFSRNQYILAPMIWLIGSIITLSVLVATRSAHDFNGLYDLETNDQSPQIGPETPAEVSILSESHSNRTHSIDQSSRTTPGTPIFANHSTHSSPQLPRVQGSPYATEMSHFQLGTRGFGLQRLAEGEWLSQEEIPCLTIDTTDYNPKVITIIQTIEDEPNSVLNV